MFKRGLGAGIGLRDTTSLITIPTIQTQEISPPLSANLANKQNHAFDANRIVEGYTANTVRLKRLSDDVEQDFGFDPVTGVFDLEAVHTWRGAGVDVDAVALYDQTGNGATCVNDGVIAFIRNNNTYNFVCDRDPLTALLTRSTTTGGVGFNLLGTGVWKIDNTTIDVVNDGIEIHFLNSTNTRKVSRPENDIDDLGTNFGGNNVRENLCSYGTGDDNYNRFYFNGTFGTYTWIQPANSFRVRKNLGHMSDGWEQYGQQVINMRFDDTESLYSVTAQEGSIALNTDNTTSVQAGNFDDGVLLVGGQFSGTAGDVGANDRGNFVYGGIVITKALTKQNRYFLHSKLTLVGQQGSEMTVAELEALFDEMVFMGDVDPTTGLCVGRKNKVTYEYNIGAGNTFNFADTDSRIGLPSISQPDRTNNENKWIANNNYMAGVVTGTVLSFYHLTNGGGNLAYSFQLADPSSYGINDTGQSLALGKDHTHYAFRSHCGTGRDLNGATGGRKWFGTYESLVDGLGQSNIKYNRITGTTGFNFNLDAVTSTWSAWSGTYDFTRLTFANEDQAAPVGLKFDAPIVPQNPRNKSLQTSSGSPVVQIATFEADDAYDRADSNAVREPLFLKSDHKLYIGLTGSVLGHIQSDIAHNPHACVPDGSDTAKLQSEHKVSNPQGHKMIDAFIPDVVLSEEQCRKVHLNFYKLFE